jgi:glycine cleavage system H lipoate-binding protein
MNVSKQNAGLKQTSTNLKECWWMQAGVVDYKLCDRDYDCEHCPFDNLFHRRNSKIVGELRDITRGAPEGLFFHPAHSWARIEEGGCVRVGLDDFAQRMLGRPYLISIAEPGSTVRSGKGCALITHQSGVAVLVAPVSGTVKEVNRGLYQQPALLNRDPYSAGWVLLIEPTNLKSCLKQLLYGPKAADWYDREFERLYAKVIELISHKPIATMNDGGFLTWDFMKALSADQLLELVDSFFPLSATEQAEPNKAILDR